MKSGIPCTVIISCDNDEDNYDDYYDNDGDADDYHDNEKETDDDDDYYHYPHHYWCYCNVTIKKFQCNKSDTITKTVKISLF